MGNTTLPIMENTVIEKYKWYKNNFEILNLANVTIEGNILKLKYLNRKIHNGLYTCRIELTNGQNISSNDFNMTIYGTIF